MLQYNNHILKVGGKTLNPLVLPSPYIRIGTGWTKASDDTTNGTRWLFTPIVDFAALESALVLTLGSISKARTISLDKSKIGRKRGSFSSATNANCYFYPGFCQYTSGNISYMLLPQTYIGYIPSGSSYAYPSSHLSYDTYGGHVNKYGSYDPMKDIFFMIFATNYSTPNVDLAAVNQGAVYDPDLVVDLNLLGINPAAVNGVMVRGGADSASLRHFSSKRFGNIEWMTENLDLQGKETNSTSWGVISPTFGAAVGFYNSGDTARCFYSCYDGWSFSLGLGSWAIFPQGWRIPTFQDWETLLATVGNSKAALEAAGFNPRGYGAFYNNTSNVAVRTDDGSDEWFAAGAPGTNTAADWYNICRITDSGIYLFDQTGYAAQGVASYNPLPCRVIRLCRDVT
jgi:uncharacterized protein (TIGR02145 family)